MEPLEFFFRIGQAGRARGIEGSKAIINLSATFVLSTGQRKVLEKGFNFIPTPEIQNSRPIFKADLSAYHRRLKLRAYFGRSREDTEPPRFHRKSGWEPGMAEIPRELRTLLIKDRMDIGGMKPRAEAQNLTPEEIECIKDLADNKTIVIKPADKGSAAVIMDRELYVAEALRQLENPEYYAKLDEPIFEVTAIRIREILEGLVKKRAITDKQLLYLTDPVIPRRRYFYLLPKIHKDPETWPVPLVVPPGRPIVSDCDSESYRVAEYLDFVLNPLSTKHESYIKDTYDFLDKIKNITIEEPCFIFTMDVDSLYTNIDTERGLQAVVRILGKFPDPRRPDKEILELLQISLDRNDFEFDGEYYLQIKGTAMGKKFAPAYANIYMADWEETVLPKCKKRPREYFRFLDDIWGIWTGSMEEFQVLVGELNAHHPSIRVKTSLQRTEINFLDVVTFKGPEFKNTGKLDTRVFFKPTDTHDLLHRSSFHPRHTFRGIVKSQFIRFNRICSRVEDRDIATKVLWVALRRRGYPRTLLRSIRKEVFEGQAPPRRQTQDQGGRLLPFVATYSTYAVRAINRAKKNFNEITGGSDLHDEVRIISALRRNPNLRDAQVRAKLLAAREQARSPGRCRTVVNTGTGRTVKLNRGITLQTGNCVYLINCRKCGKVYVGGTGGRVAMRRSHHLYNIRTGKKTNTWLVQHFMEHGVEHFRMMGVEHNPRWSQEERRKAEKRWIRLLGSKYPQGLNGE